jgi:hypothetical protein
MPRKNPRDPNTFDLFEAPRPEERRTDSMSFGGEVSGLVGEVLDGTPDSRHQIAAEMTRLSGRTVSKHMLDAYASEARDTFNIPFYLVPALEAATDSTKLSAWLAEKRGGRLYVGREVISAEIGKAEEIRDQANREIKRLKKMLGEEED